MNLDEEVRYGYTIKPEIKAIWSIQLAIVKQLFAVCKKYNLKIWAGSGTLIGAVRDGGYIPWDDDIDLGMFRDDYDKLVRVAPDEFKSPFYFQSANTEFKYPRGHAQIRMDDTAEILFEDVFQNFHQGVFVDVFVLDAVPDSNYEYLKLKKTALKMSRRLFQYSYSTFSFRKPWSFFEMIYSKILISHVGFYNYFAKYDNLFRKYKISENMKVSYMAYRFQEKKIFDKHLYDEILWKPFEDIMMPVPKGYDIILRAEYGDYTVRKMVSTTHGGPVIIDANKSYKEYLPNLRQEYRKHWLQNKIKRLYQLLWTRLKCE